MSIIIQNISKHWDVAYGKGKQHYRLLINDQIKCEFTHNFEDGLSECLRKAADAFEREEKKYLLESVDRAMEYYYNEIKR